MKQDNIIKVDYDNKWNGQQKDDEVTGSLLYSQIGQVESKVNQTQVHTRNTLSLLMLPSKCNARRKTWSTRPTKTSHTVCSRKNLKEVHNFTRMLFWWILIISWVKLPSGIVVSVWIPKVAHIQTHLIFKLIILRYWLIHFNILHFFTCNSYFLNFCQSSTFHLEFIFKPYQTVSLSFVFY